MKRVLLIVIDGWTPEVFSAALERGELPTFAELSARGVLRLDCLSIFPSITPAATASIVTGHYPSHHGIGGMCWWDSSTNEVAYYGDDVSTAMQRGAGDFLRHFLLDLNGDRLLAPTMFQIVERQQRKAACFNHLIFRGDVAHEVTHPWLLRLLLPSVSKGVTVHGPSWLCLGDFVSHTGRNVDVEAPGGPFNRFGLDDEGTEEFLKDVADAGRLPDFTVAYFADYDFESHDKGPRPAVSVLRRLDQRLASLFRRWGGLDEVLGETSIVMTADHGHSEVEQGDSAAIDLGESLRDYRCGDPARGWGRHDELLVCPNMRAAEVFHRFVEDDRVSRLADSLLHDKRVDQVIWRAADRGEPPQFHVRTRDRGAVTFCRAAASEHAVADEYGGRWAVHGDLEVLDLTLHDRSLGYGIYPNALERIASGVAFPEVGRMWVTAREGCEFAVTGQSVHHGAGSHGTLHARDTRVPLLIAGSPRRIELSSTPRIVDVVPICAEILGVRFEAAVGQSR